jgi:tetratricopeptide (TPR) repeat protein
MFRRFLASRRLARWLGGRSTLATLLGLGESDRADLLWYASRLARAKSPDDALRLYDLLGHLWPGDDPSVLLGRGVCLQLRGALDEAERAYDTVLQAEPDNVYARANRAEVRLLQGRDQAARDDLTLGLAALARTTAPRALRNRVQTLHQVAARGVPGAEGGPAPGSENGPQSSPR